MEEYENEMKGIKMDNIYYFWLRLKIYFCFALNGFFLSRVGIDKEVWKHKFIVLSETQEPRTEEILHEFFSCKLIKIAGDKKIKRKNQKAPILFCVIKNDIEKIERFMYHYRKLGVEVFVFLDNDSTDGTTEFLCQQPDTIVWSCKQTYSSVRRVVWINWLLAAYGCNRWCMVVDSDELIDFIDSEKYTLVDIIKEAEKRNCKRIQGFMLDMYSKEILFQQEEMKDFVSKNCFFDKDSYSISGSNIGIVIGGGPRNRVLKTKVCLSKCPIFYFGINDIIPSSHYIIPVEPVSKCPIWIAICHYKFMSSKDMLKVREAVEKEIYANNSQDYRSYLEKIDKENTISFYDEQVSVELKTSKDLRNLKFLKTPFNNQNI